MWFLLLASVLTRALTYVVNDWGTHFGYCNLNFPYRQALQSIAAGLGDVIEIRFAPPFKVLRYPSQAAWWPGRARCFRREEEGKGR